MKEVNFRYINCLKYLSYLEIQNPHLSDDNISRGFFLVPIIEIFESTFAVAEEALIDESLPGMAVVEPAAATRLPEKRLPIYVP